MLNLLRQEFVKTKAGSALYCQSEKQEKTSMAQQQHHHHTSIREDYFSTRKLIFNWKLLLMRILVNGFAIAIAAFLLPGILIETSSLIINLLILGLVFGLLNAFIKPFIQVLTISLIFVTYGLVVIIINTIMLFLLDFLMGDLFQIDNIFAGIMGGIIISLLSLILDNIFGMTPPIMDDETFERMAREWPSQGMGFVARERKVELDKDPDLIPSAPSTAVEDNVSETTETATNTEVEEEVEVPEVEEGVSADSDEETAVSPPEEPLPPKDNTQEDTPS